MRGETNIFFDGRFWVGLFSVEWEGKLVRIGKYIFGSEPTLAQLDEWMANGAPGLVMTEVDGLAGVDASEQSAEEAYVNPKRRLREARREMESAPRESLAQKAMRDLVEKDKQASAGKRSVDRKRRNQERFEKRQAKKKKKQRGY